METSEYTVVLVGHFVCGKTSLVDRYVRGHFNPYVGITVGVDFATKTVYQDHDRGVRLNLYDTAGHGRFRSAVWLACRQAHAAVIVYDITQEGSLQYTKEWFHILRDWSHLNVFTALAGNKADLERLRKVTYEDGQSFARDNGVDLFMEVSALTGENVEELFLTIVELLETTRHKYSKALNLEGKRLLRISATVTKLTEVEVLNLSYNELTKLPRSTSNLAKLTTLNLNHNKLTQFPEVCLDLINLTHLFVNDNQLSTLPANLNSLEKLQELELRNNKLKRVFKYIVDLHNLEKLSVTGNPLTFQEIRSLMMLMDLKSERMSIDIAAPAEIQAQGDFQKLLYENALKEGFVNVYRGRVLLVGQDRAGKTSLKKSLLGLPFNPKEPSTEGIEVDPSVCEIEVDCVKNWNSTSESKASLVEFSEDISRMLAEKQYHWLVNEVKEHSEVISELELTGEELTVEVDTNSYIMNQVYTGRESANIGCLRQQGAKPPGSVA